MDEIVLRDISGGRVFCDFFSMVMVDEAIIFPGNILQIKVKSALLGNAEVLAVRHFKVHQTREFLAAAEIGEHSVKLFMKRIEMQSGKVAAGDKLVHVVFRYNTRNFEGMEELMTEWWNSQKLSN